MGHSVEQAEAFSHQSLPKAHLLLSFWVLELDAPGGHPVPGTYVLSMVPLRVRTYRVYQGRSL